MATYTNQDLLKLTPEQVKNLSSEDKKRRELLLEEKTKLRLAVVAPELTFPPEQS